VLVTGATGFIGTHLTRRLAESGHGVTCLVRPTSNVDRLEPLGVRFAMGDVRDADSLRPAVEKSDIIYHLAGLTTAFRADDMVNVNATGFRNVAQACAARLTPPTLVYVSSLAAAGPAQGGRPRTEHDPPAPVSHYGRAKRAGEVAAHEFADRVAITVVRPPIVFGEWDPSMRELFRSIFRLGVHVAFGVARQRYSLIHASDLAEAIVLCGERGKRLATQCTSCPESARGYYFAAADEQPTFAELGRLIGLSLGRARVWVCGTSGPIMLWSAAAGAEALARLRGAPYIFNFDKAREAQAGSWTCSSEAIRGELGFSPRASLIDRLRQTAEWYRQQNWL
jgi:nucleoside-diphosphate-sugar epimerase